MITEREEARLTELGRFERSAALGGAHLHQVLRLASAVFGIENVAVAVVGKTTHRCCAWLGSLDSRELLREGSICNTTIHSDGVLLVEDLRADDRFNSMGLRIGGEELRFYAGAPLVSHNGHAIGVLCLFDKSPHRFSELQIEQLSDLAVLAVDYLTLLVQEDEARFDPLTRLRNHAFLTEMADSLIESGEPISALKIDLDGFKSINDALGNRHGDDVLREVANRLVALSPATSTIARTGADDFSILLPGETDADGLSALADICADELSRPVLVNGHLMPLKASTGLVVRTSEKDSRALLSNAELAMYSAKAEGRGGYKLYSKQMRDVLLDRGNVILELRSAFEDGALELYYQPFLNIADGEVSGAEALLRWNYPYRGVLTPGEFLPVLEQSDMAVPVGTWIIREACRQAAIWRRERNGTFKIAVNLFEAQFKTGDLVETVIDALEEHELPPEALTIEITERVILTRDESVKEQVAQLKDLGVGIAFDDFGTGFASLSALKTFPVTILKIDRSFVSNAPGSEEDCAIIDSLLHIARTFGFEVVAEGIETKEQYDLLRTRLCPTGQGFLIGRPVPASRFYDFAEAGIEGMRA